MLSIFESDLRKMERTNEIETDKIKKLDRLIERIDIGNAQLIFQKMSKISENTFVSNHNISNTTNIFLFLS